MESVNVPILLHPQIVAACVLQDEDVDPVFGSDENGDIYERLQAKLDGMTADEIRDSVIAVYQNYADALCENAGDAVGATTLDECEGMVYNRMRELGMDVSGVRAEQPDA